MAELRPLLERAAELPEEPDAFDQLRRRRAVRQRRRQVGIAVLALVIAAGGIWGAVVALTPRGHPFVPGDHPSTPRPSVSVAPSTSVSPSSSPTSSPSASPARPVLCSNTGMEVSLVGSQGAAGTIRSVWRARNVSGEPCRSFAYPGMDVHGPGGWLNLQVHRGGFPDLDQAPRNIVVQPGGSLYFVSYWSDVVSNGACTQFDRVKVTLPNNFVSNVVPATGCLDPGSVDVGPVTTVQPTP